MTISNDKDTQRVGRISDVDLILVIIISFAGLAFISVPQLSDTVMRTGIETAIPLFVPGYSLIAAIYPGRTDITGFERVALSFGLSVAVVPLLAYGLNFTAWGLSVQSVAAALILFIVASTLIAYARRHALPLQARFSLSLDTTASLVSSLRPRIDRKARSGLVMLLAFSVLFSASALVYSLATPEPRENYTELYLLGPDGKMEGYPTNFTLGQAKPVTVGITNHENRDVNYSLVINLVNAASSSTLYSSHQTLASGQTIQKAIALTPDRAGNNMKMEFLLYLDNDFASPYRQTYLLVNVTSA